MCTRATFCTICHLRFVNTVSLTPWQLQTLFTDSDCVSGCVALCVVSVVSRTLITFRPRLGEEGRGGKNSIRAMFRTHTFL